VGYLLRGNLLVNAGIKKGKVRARASRPFFVAVILAIVADD